MTREPLLTTCENALRSNGFEVFRAASAMQAREVFCQQILPGLRVATASWGDSQTLLASGILDELLARPEIEVIKTFDPHCSPRELIERRRQALLTDLFLTGSNAVTLQGQLVNLDMIGNRIAPLAFGPKKVVIVVGRNKLAVDLPAAMQRVKNIAAPLNAQRHQMPTPCAKSSRCHDCSSPKRICNSWSIIDKCFPPQRIKVILVDADLGL